MGVSISLELNNEPAVRQWLGGIQRREVPAARRRLVRRVSRSALVRTIENNPVDTARSRASWVAALEQLGGSAPAGWAGSHPKGAAISEGRSRSGFVESSESEVTKVVATSGVDYINYLEFGTQRMSPFQMVARSLQSLRPAVPLQPFFAAAEDEMGSMV
ncbi:hypothetical protein CA54_07950 [Symmachiella macrocystis]|uniref:Uncharacterized protein n=1 Tax=Symmachiella macrocystis TaxID=2527985 RepID=A0A5C6BLG8_9PLAN|nr:hypothetical protein [Symmachiella macrocystis]TWU11979.1 hypothetical protein CA54_07950 [Symmachiella macrocystis]